MGADQLEIFYSNKNNNSTKFIKTISFNYKRNFTYGFMLEFNSGYGERMPTLQEKFGFYLFNRFDGYDYLGNPFLKPENTLSAEITAGFISSSVEFKLSPFYQSIGDYILGRVMKGSPMTSRAKGVKSYSNFSRAELRGLDMIILAKAGDFQFINSIKYTCGIIIDNGAAPLMPPLKSVTSLRYQFHKFDWQGEWEISSSQNHVSEMSGEQTTAGYSLFHLRAGFKAAANFKINTGVKNIADLRYREHLDWGGIMRPGRNIYIHVNFAF